MKLERSIIHKGNEIRMRLNRYKQNPAAFGEDKTVFDVIYYGADEDEVPVTYGNLYSVYQDVVRNAIEEQLRVIDTVVKKYADNPYDPNCDTFKIVLVGGFGKYALVKDQVYRHYKIISEKDKRVNFGISGKSESAVAFGAALIANNQITVRRTASQSMGIVGKDQNGKPAFRYAILYGQIMQENTVYYLRENPDPDYPNRNVIRVAFYPNEGIGFAINDSDDMTKTYCHKLKPEYCAKLTEIEGGIYAVGFSIDSNNIIYLVLSQYNGGERKAGSIRHRIRLDSYEKMFIHDNVTFFDEDSSLKQG